MQTLLGAGHDASDDNDMEPEDLAERKARVVAVGGAHQTTSLVQKHRGHPTRLSPSPPGTPPP